MKLIDFGVAELAEKPETDLPKIDESLTIVPVPSKAGLEGTKTFLSPECWEGNIFFFTRKDNYYERADYKEICFARDVWALGIIFYEMVAGENPFKSNNEQE